ncbi:8-oxo-dGTP diphosphatase [Rubricella aquisinus]|uniref:8-oxo-dGTP diphosphatase n=1 Tax=Rubricella aquisinus TaxID=2028108 RepID=A0A840WST5_9RHOB|nr:NUDIX hydrolase [Rubricella aquisinus]MBB5514270.1 8-oxo-dGTP diphosphatase [Rubricella aquisinus]
MRRFGERYVQGAPYRDRPGAYGIIGDGAGRILLAHSTGKDGGWLLPGGGVDPGEGPVAALHREVMEETGWRIAPRRRLTVYQRYVFMPDYGWWARKVCHIYLARAVLPLRDPTEPDHTPIWLSADEAARRLTVGAEAHALRTLIRSGVSF